MTRDACLEAPFAGDFNCPDGLSGATRNGRTVFRFGRAAETGALDLPGLGLTKQGQPLADHMIRGHLARLALDNHRTLFPKER